MGITTNQNWLPALPQWSLVSNDDLTSPVTVSEFRTHLRLDATAFDPTLEVSLQPIASGTGTTTGIAVSIAGFQATTQVSVGTLGSGSNVTYVVQDSPDSSTWANQYTFPAISTANTALSHLYTGAQPYIRVVATVMGGIGGNIFAGVILETEVTDETDLLSGLLLAATEYAEKYVRRALTSRSFTLSLDYWPNVYNVPWAIWPTELRLPVPPVTSIDSVTYVDNNGNRQTLDPSQYQSDLNGKPARIWPAYGQSWPTTRYQQNSVQITFTAGFSTVPPSTRVAILLLAAHWYENREAVITGTISTSLQMTVDALLGSLKWGSYA